MTKRQNKYIQDTHTTCLHTHTILDNGYKVCVNCGECLEKHLVQETQPITKELKEELKKKEKKLSPTSKTNYTKNKQYKINQIHKYHTINNLRVTIRHRVYEILTIFEDIPKMYDETYLFYIPNEQVISNFIDELYIAMIKNGVGNEYEQHVHNDVYLYTIYVFTWLSYRACNDIITRLNFFKRKIKGIRFEDFCRMKQDLNIMRNRYNKNQFYDKKFTQIYKNITQQFTNTVKNFENERKQEILEKEGRKLHVFIPNYLYCMFVVLYQMFPDHAIEIASKHGFLLCRIKLLAKKYGELLPYTKSIEPTKANNLKSIQIKFTQEQEEYLRRKKYI